jgi:hypothetical protein
MAGAGVKVFVSGEVLTAAQVNGYLMDQVIARFSTEAARDAAYGGSGQPSLTEGRFCYIDETDDVQYFNGSEWQSAQQFTIGDGTVTEVKLADGAVTANKIGTSAVTAAKIGSGAVTASKIASGAVGASQLASDSVTTDKIADGTIVNADISSSAAIEIGKLADVSINTRTASYTLVLTDKNKLVEMNVASANQVTVPTNASVAFPVGTQITLFQYGAGKTQVVAAVPATTTIRSTPGVYLRTQYSSAALIKRATDEWILIGDLSAS